MVDINKLKQDIKFDVDLFGCKLFFLTTWGLFSPREIDAGTYLLLKHLKIGNSDKCLDIGCGYGVIGIWMAKKSPDIEVHMIDKDFLAVEYSNKNAKINGVNNAHAYLSNAFSRVDKIKFDTVVSNIPAKVGRELLSIILLDAKNHLAPGGQIVVVTITGLREFMKKNLKEVFGNYEKIKQGNKYTVARAILE